MYIFGRNPVLESLRSGEPVAKIFFRYGTRGETINEIRTLARKRNVPYVTLSKQKFERLGKTENSQGIGALIEDVRTVALEDLLAVHREQDAAFYIALDSITDPHNVGAILRSAECAGVHGIILPVRDTAPLTETVVKASSGSITHQVIARVNNLHQTLEQLKKKGVWIVGMDSEGDTDLLAMDGDRPLCIVVGSEGKGLRPLIKRSCDLMVRIPMWGHIESLNASVAAALVMYEVRRKRLG